MMIIMASIALILISLIALLAIANFVVLKNKKKPAAKASAGRILNVDVAAVAERHQQESIELNKTRQKLIEVQDKLKVEQNPSNVLYGEIFNLQSKCKILDETISMAHNRITDVEKNLIGLNSLSKEDSQIIINNLRELNSKLRELENFRANTKVELTGMKEISLEMKEFLKEKSRV